MVLHGSNCSLPLSHPVQRQKQHYSEVQRAHHNCLSYIGVFHADKSLFLCFLYLCSLTFVFMRTVALVQSFRLNIKIDRLHRLQSNLLSLCHLPRFQPRPVVWNEHARNISLHHFYTLYVSARLWSKNVPKFFCYNFVIMFRNGFGYRASPASFWPLTTR